MTAAAAAPRMTTARDAGLVGCRRCGAVSPAGAAKCRRCGARPDVVDAGSLQTVWALLAVGLIAYVPANIWPMLRVSRFGTTQESTIVGGVIDLVDHGAYGVAAIVGVASVVVPVAKFLVIAWLAVAIAARRRRAPNAHALHRMHRLVELVGRWSMVDIFVVAILAALVQLGLLAAIHPGIAAVFFAVSVVFTMLAAQAFDPRLLWLEHSAPPLPRPSAGADR